jgi:hypothetical protein
MNVFEREENGKLTERAISTIRDLEACFIPFFKNTSDPIRNTRGFIMGKIVERFGCQWTDCYEIWPRTPVLFDGG